MCQLYQQYWLFSIDFLDFIDIYIKRWYIIDVFIVHWKINRHETLISKGYNKIFSIFLLNWKLRFVGNLLIQCGEKYFGWLKRIVCKISSSG